MVVFMQFAKDTFYMTLRSRLAALNPQRTVTLHGAVRPAVIAAENELTALADPLPNAFYLQWASGQVLAQPPNSRLLMEMECSISYFTLGTVDSGVDRGRTLAQLDAELLSICQPCHTMKRDYTQSPSLDMGTGMFWTPPCLGEIRGADARSTTSLAPRLQRTAQVQLFFFAEGNAL
jgi:hypothetical protein